MGGAGEMGERRLASITGARTDLVAMSGCKGWLAKATVQGERNWRTGWDSNPR